jgi:hypothetical protein
MQPWAATEQPLQDTANLEGGTRWSMTSALHFSGGVVLGGRR